MFIYLDIELDEVDGETAGEVEGEDGVLLDLFHPPVRRRQSIHPLPPVPDDDELRRLERRFQFLRPCSQPRMPQLYPIPKFHKKKEN